MAFSFWRAANPDIKLIERSRAGDRDAFDVIVARHKKRIFNLLYRMTGDREWAEEITLEVFLEAHCALHGFKHEAKFYTWLHRIAINVCLEHMRSRKAQPQWAEVPFEEWRDQIIPAPAEQAMDRCLAEQITSVMLALPEAQRAALVMFYLEERNCAEIAEILSIPRSTVKTRIFYGTRALRDKLREAGIVPEGEASLHEV
jgi:RNA polymerase sigma-70 factor (ECF subfamily)